MTRLSNGTEFINPHFSEEAGEFLLLNGFTCNTKKDALHFRSGYTLLIVRMDTVDHYEYNPQEEDEAERWIFCQSHTGIAKLNVFGWIMLMHVMDVVSLPKAIANAKKEGAQRYTEANFLINSALTHSSTVKP
jgi:hypothetical protein